MSEDSENMAIRTNNAVAHIERSLRRLERRRRALTIAAAASLWVFCVVPAAGLLCLLDWYSNMPLPVRWLATIGLIGLAAVLFRRFVLPAVRNRFVIDRNALDVERTFPQLADRVISAVQLERHHGDPGYGSEEMIQAAQRQAAEWAARVPFGRAAPLVPAAPLIGLAACVLAAAGWLAIANRDIVAIWAMRCVWKMDYPHKTRIEHVKVNDSETMRVARGEPALITVLAGGRLLPDRGRIQIRTRGAGRVVIDLFPVDRAGARNRYTARIEQVVEPLPFRIFLGDATPVDGQIDVTDRPEVSDIRLDLTYPAYTGMKPEPIRSGHVRAVAGTRVHLNLQASKPLASARAAFDAGDSQALAVSGADGGASTGATWGTDFTVGRSGGYTVGLVDREGFANAAPVHYQIVVMPDLPPKTQLVRPAAEALATPTSIIRLDYWITDDYGLSRGRLMFCVQPQGVLRESASNGGAKEYRRIPLPLPGLTSAEPDAKIAAPGPREARQVLVWDLATLGLKVNDIIAYHLDADDHAPRTEPMPGVCPDRQIRIVDEAVLRKQLQDQLESTAQEIERIYTLERESQEHILQVQKELLKRPKEPNIQ